jgi:hypothetical protein
MSLYAWTGEYPSSHSAFCTNSRACLSGIVVHDVCQKQLETVVPRPGDMVLMLRGPQKMQRARLMQKDNKVMLAITNTMMMQIFIILILMWFVVIQNPEFQKESSFLTAL